MGYYRGVVAGDFYRGYGRAGGDYYYNRGDFWKKAKKALGKVATVAPVAAAMVPTKTGVFNALGTLSQGASFLPAGGAASGGGLTGLLDIATKGLSMYSAAKAAGSGQEYVPAAKDNPLIPNVLEKFWDGTQRKRRTMNAGNASALRRALRRVDAFQNLAKRSGAMPKVRRLAAARGCGNKSCKTCG